MVLLLASAWIDLRPQKRDTLSLPGFEQGYFPNRNQKNYCLSQLAHYFYEESICKPGWQNSGKAIFVPKFYTSMQDEVMHFPSQLYI
jgi:hypothetical protein